MRVLVTGAGGFVGAELVRTLLRDTVHSVVAIDSFRHRGVTDRLTREVDGVKPSDWLGTSRFTIILHNMAAEISVQMAARIGRIDTVLALASGSHVDSSIANPREFTENNIAVALTTLEYVRTYARSAHLVLVSTDEVYGPVEPGYLHPEWGAIVPSNPYSASKAAQEALAVAWWRSYRLMVTITNMHNVYGPMQHPEKFVPKVLARVLRGDQVEIHGTGPDHGSRHWLHVSDAANAILAVAAFRPEVFKDGLGRPARWNIASGDRYTNLQTAMAVAAAAGRQLSFGWSDARPGRDQHYGLTSRKLNTAGWYPRVAFEDGIAHTVKWFTENPEWLEG